MVIWQSFCPFFSEVNTRLTQICEDEEKAKEELIARDPVLYQKTMFRAFLHLERDEVENMSMQEYIDNHILLNEVLKLIHAPFSSNKE